MAQGVTGRALITLEAIRREAAEEVATELAKLPLLAGRDEVLAVVSGVLEKYRPILFEHMQTTNLAAWVAGYQATARTFPSRLVDYFSERPPLVPFSFEWPGGDEPIVRFPLIENAAKSLAQRNIMSRQEWEQAERSAQNEAFFITADIEKAVIENVRDALRETIDDGASLQNFRARVAAVAEAEVLKPHHVENIYRTNIQGAFRDGRETLAANPIVAAVFPYQQYIATHDARTRKEHRALETLGLNGTAIYRRDDPMWDFFTVPWSWNCRCSVILLTIRQAAAAGVREAQEWLETGMEPRRPEWRLDAIPFRPTDGFGTRGRIAA